MTDIAPKLLLGMGWLFFGLAISSQLQELYPMSTLEAIVAAMIFVPLSIPVMFAVCYLLGSVLYAVVGYFEEADRQ